MRRFFNWLKAIFNRGMDKLEDPEIMLDQAKRDMQAALSSNREKAVQAITQRNRLQGLLDDTLKKSDQLEQQAVMALKQGNRDLATQFMREKLNTDAQKASLQTSFDSASATVEQVKVGIRRQEEEVRKRTAEALAMKAQWKNAQIQNSISKALEGLTFENQFEGFGAAAEKIKMAQSEAAARNEMLGESLQGKVLDMQDKARDLEAESELEKLEQRLGLKSATTETEAPQTVSITPNGQPPTQPAEAEAGAAAPDPALQSEAEKEIDELEKRIKGQST